MVSGGLEESEGDVGGRGGWRMGEECGRAQAVVVTRVAVFGKGVSGKRPLRSPTARTAATLHPAPSPTDDASPFHLSPTALQIQIIPRPQPTMAEMSRLPSYCPVLRLHCRRACQQIDASFPE